MINACAGIVNCGVPTGEKRIRTVIEEERRGKRMRIAVSACLLGVNCRYCGTGCRNEAVVELAGTQELVPVCPEILGGLPTPRSPVELTADRRAVAVDGTDCTEQFRRGAAEALALAQLLGCQAAVLKKNSPSCGCGQIYDGTFSHRLIPGSGMTGAAFLEAGIPVYNEDTCAELIKEEFTKKETSAVSGTAETAEAEEFSF